MYICALCACFVHSKVLPYKFKNNLSAEALWAHPKLFEASAKSSVLYPRIVLVKLSPQLNSFWDAITHTSRTKKLGHGEHNNKLMQSQLRSEITIRAAQALSQLARSPTAKTHRCFKPPYIYVHVEKVLRLQLTLQWIIPAGSELWFSAGTVYRFISWEVCESVWMPAPLTWVIAMATKRRKYLCF